VDGVPSVTATWTDTRVVGYVAEGARLDTVPVWIENAAGSSNQVNLLVTARERQGRIRWRLRMDTYYSAVRPAVGTDGTIYAVDVTNRLYAVSPDGALLWVANQAGSKGVAVGLDGTIYTGNENWVKAFNPDGSPRWTFVQNPRAFIFLDVGVGPDGNIYAATSSGMGVFSLDPAGHLRWATPEAYNRPNVIYAEINFGPGPDGRPQLYFYANGHTRAIRLEDGASVFTAGGGAMAVSPLDGTLHFPSSALRPDGTLFWQFGEFLNGGPDVSSDGVHYATTSMITPRLYAIAPNGTERWHVTLSDQAGRSDVNPSDRFVITGGNNTLNYAGVVMAHDAARGTLLWRQELPAEETAVYNPWIGRYGFNQYVDSGVDFGAAGETVYFMTAIAPGGLVTDRAFLYAFDSDPALGSPSTLLRSTDITLSGRSRRGRVTVGGAVTVQDESRNAISGATVFATWTLPDGSTAVQSAGTDANGKAKFSVTKGGGFYTLTVRTITKPGYTFDRNGSVISQTIAWY
jgi:outer membrane protein assembly factor BamB